MHDGSWFIKNCVYIVISHIVAKRNYPRRSGCWLSRAVLNTVFCSFSQHSHWIWKEPIISSCCLITLTCYAPAIIASLSSLCRVRADAGNALCLCGAVQEESWPGVWAAGHNQQLRMKDAKPVSEALRKSKGASPDMSTVVFSCSYISSSTPCTIHDKVANTDDVVWGGWGLQGETSYLLTCIVSYCYFKCSFFLP